MASTKRCDENLMDCYGNSCSFYCQPIPNYALGSTIPVLNYTCKVFQKYIASEFKTDKLFGDTCKPNHLRCALHDGSMIVWKKDIIHYYPYVLVDTFDVTSNDGHIFIAKSKNWLFQIVDDIRVCDSNTFMRTVEGLFLSIEETKNLSQTPKDYKANAGIVLADMDFENYETLRIISELSYINCLRFTAVLNILRYESDRFLIHFDDIRNPLVLYANYGNIFLPKCANVTYMVIITKTEKCYRDVPIKFKLNNTTLNGFLSIEGIVRISSEIIECQIKLDI